MGRAGAACGDPNCPSGVRNGVGHWSHMACRDADRGVEHQNHTWDGDYTIYGPYWCWGIGVQAPPADPSRKQYTANPNTEYKQVFWDEQETREVMDLPDDTDIWVRTVSYTQWKRVPRE